MEAIQLNNFLFEPLMEEDFPLLHKWLNELHVFSEWGGAQSIEEVRSKYSRKIVTPGQEAFIVSKDGERFGYVQSCRATKAGTGWWPNESDTTVCIDQFLGIPAFLGRGLGSAMIQEFSDWLLTQIGTKKIIADPRPTNERAIRCYEKASFHKVGLVNTPDGEALLMEKKLDNN